MYNGQEHFSSVWFCECECEIIFPYQSITPTIYVSNIFCIFGKRNVIIKILVYRLKNYHQITTFNLYNFILYNLKNKTLVLGLRLWCLTSLSTNTCRTKQMFSVNIIKLRFSSLKNGGRRGREPIYYSLHNLFCNNANIQITD